ncbi:MAG: transcriptional regulator [Synergistaceae bacterium]|nr:transcriptional regulator [Synergistaceae bacterium]
MKRIDMGARHIALDSITREFLSSLRELRLMYGLTREYVAQTLGFCSDSLLFYEIMKWPPSLKPLNLLAEYYGADISRSVNWQYFHRQIDFAGLRHEMKKRNLTCQRLGFLIGYSGDTVGAAVNNTPKGSLICLSKVIEELRHPREKHLAMKWEAPHSTSHAGKFACLDETTAEFLHTLKARRISMGLSQRKLGEILGVSQSSIYSYELGENHPSLPVLMKMAEFFGVDLSKSINFKYHHRKINFKGLNSQLLRNGLTRNEAVRLAGYTGITGTLSYNLTNSLECLSAVIEVSAHEDEAYRKAHEVVPVKRKRRTANA